jgi:hypothetical protein
MYIVRERQGCRFPVSVSFLSGIKEILGHVTFWRRIEYVDEYEYVDAHVLKGYTNELNTVP